MRLRQYRAMPLLVVIVALNALLASAANYYVAPQPGMRASSSTDSGDGSFANPWDLKWTLEHRGPSFKPGDVIWLTNGVYHWSYQWGGSQAFNFTDPMNATTPIGAVAPFTTRIVPVGLNGAAGNPIIVRALPGCHAVVDGWFNISSAACNYVRFQDLDVGMISYTNRATGLSVSSGYWYWGNCKLDGAVHTGSDLDQSGFGGAVPYPTGVELVNCYIHDCGNCGIGGGLGMVYGCIFQHNGFYNNDSGTTGVGARGHGFYYQGKSGMDYCYLRNCITTGNCKLGGQANGTGGGGGNYMNMLWDGLICYNNGTIAGGTQLSGGNDLYHSYELDFASESDGNTLLNDGVVNCLTWTKRSAGLYFALVDFSGEAVSGYFLCTNNFFAIETPQSSYVGNNLPNNSLVNCTGNTFIGQVASHGASVFPNNTYLSTYPTTGSKVVVEANAYEPLRGQIAVYNYAGATSVNVSLSSLGYTQGMPYTLHNASDYWGDMVTGIYNGSYITIDMQPASHSVAAPVGANFQKEPSSIPDFGAFVIQSGSSTNIVTGGTGTNQPPTPPIPPGGTTTNNPPATTGTLTGNGTGPSQTNAVRSTDLTYFGSVIADYHMDGTWADSMNLCPSLTTNGATVGFSTWCGWMTKPSGYSMYSQNYNDTATARIPHSLLLSNGTFGIAIEAMVYAGNLGLTNGTYPIIGLTQGSNALQLLDGTSTTFAGTTVTPAMLTSNTWHYVKLMLDTNGYSLKVDADTVISVASQDFFNWNPNTDATLTLGNFAGLLDEVDIKSYNNGGTVVAPGSQGGQTNSPALLPLKIRMNAGVVELSISGPAGSNYVLQTATQLAGSNSWQTVRNLILSNTPSVLSDPGTNTQRFYRAVINTNAP